MLYIYFVLVVYCVTSAVSLSFCRYMGVINREQSRRARAKTDQLHRAPLDEGMNSRKGDNERTKTVINNL